MAIAKVVLNGTTQMDTTQVTVTAETLAQSVTALGADGTLVTGTLADRNNAVFSMSDFVSGPNKWTAQNCIPDVLKTGGCIHLIYTLQNNPTSSGPCIIAFGIGALSDWSPAASNPTVFINVSANSSVVQAYFRGVGNVSMPVSSYADENDKVDIKLYADHFIDVNTGISYNYNSGAQSCMTAIAEADYISVGQNQSSPFEGIITLVALEED